jgi:hypothetical protein
MPPRRLILLVCLNSATTTISIVAFPALLPELGAAATLADWQLGAVAGAFGLARMVANVPVGASSGNCRGSDADDDPAGPCQQAQEPHRARQP